MLFYMLIEMQNVFLEKSVPVYLNVRIEKCYFKTFFLNFRDPWNGNDPEDIAWKCQ